VQPLHHARLADPRLPHDRQEARPVRRDGVEHAIEDDDAIVVPAGARHNVINTGSGPLKFYTVYGPPEHRDGTVHATKADAREEHFDGKTTE
jgi:oxalate decarboxylase/phosphoglucose isomerase-like protein (cupin superfamily)